MSVPFLQAPALHFSITLFGPIQVIVAGEPMPRLHSSKSLWLLALLALRHGRPVEREWLAGTLWPDAGQDQAMGSLRSTLSDLRKALGSQGQRLRSPRRHAVLLELAGADVDTLQFDQAISDRGLPALARAVSLYRGPLLEGCTMEWVWQERSAREQDCLRALQTLADAAQNSGNNATAANYWRKAIALDSHWEAARRGLMEALARDGDINAALQVYREFVRLLRDDPKAVPHQETDALYARLRAQARQGAGARPKAAASEAETLPPAVAGYLPHPLTDLIGREDEILEVVARLWRSRLVTLTGVGGIGKTRLALAVAAEVVREFADGVWLVSLEAVADRKQVVGQIATVLQVKEAGGTTLLDSVTAYLRTKRLMLVVDNCEHLLEESAWIVGHLLKVCPGLRILATSRTALGITGETAWAVPALSVPDLEHLPTKRTTLHRVLVGYEGVRLFIERAEAVQKTFSLTAENAPAVARVCTGLEGVPLALELAAARVRAMTVEQMAERLDDHLSLLTGGSRTAFSRQQTLRATLDWSYALLGEPERRLLVRLSVFAGGWTLCAAEVVCASDTIEAAHILDLLTRLVDQSLVVFEATVEGTGPMTGRYHLLETVRQYAAEQLRQSKETERFKARHRAWLTALTEESLLNWRGPEQVRWQQRLIDEYDNLRATLNWEGAVITDPEADLRLVGALWPLWDLRALYSEGRGYLERALARGGASGATAARARALRGAANLSCSLGDYASAARGMYLESLSITRSLGDKEATAKVLHGLSNVVQEQGDYPMAITLLEECLGLCREIENPLGIAFALGALGVVQCSRGNYAVARALHEEGLLLRRKLGDTTGIANALGNLGVVAYFQKEWATAQAFYEESLSLQRMVGSKQGIALILANLGGVIQAQGGCEAAEDLFNESHLLFREIEDQWGMGVSLAHIGRAAYLRGNPTEARGLHRESLSIRRDIGDREGVAESLGQMAVVTLALGVPEKAVRLQGAVQALRENIGAPMPPPEQEEYDQLVKQARSTLGEDGFATASNEGYSLTWEQAAEYALEDE